MSDYISNQYWNRRLRAQQHYQQFTLPHYLRNVRLRRLGGNAEPYWAYLNNPYRRSLRLPIMRLMQNPQARALRYHRLQGRVIDLWNHRII